MNHLPDEMADNHHPDPNDPDTPETWSKRTADRRWEPGELSSRELEQVLIDALADIWTDNFRRDQRTYSGQLARFRRTVNMALYSATGLDLEINR